jgi:hypothetical protein
VKRTRFVDRRVERYWPPTECPITPTRRSSTASDADRTDRAAAAPLRIAPIKVRPLVGLEAQQLRETVH